MAKSVGISVYRPFSIEVVTRAIKSAKPGSAEPRHDFTRKFVTRASVKTRGGVAEIAAVEINGKRVSHTFSIRYTTLPFDIQDYVRDARGTLYAILAVENKDEADRELLIHCAAQGAETVEAAR